MSKTTARHRCGEASASKMACYYPITGYKSKLVNPSGKRGIVFNKRDGFEDLPVTINCGQCVGCRLEKSRQWAIRCIHESKLHEENSFLTLTYDNEHLPHDGSLNKHHHQKFMKRLRKKNSGKKIRFFHCGEYGDNTSRPHYHTLLFGHDFKDKIQISETQGTPLYVSEELNQLWGKGFCTIGAVTFESAAYVARYVLKKITGVNAEEHYQSLDPYTGEVHQIKPEYITMSRRPGIGHDWLKEFESDVYPLDEVIVRGKPMKPPRYYDTLMELKNPEGIEHIKRARREAAEAHKDNQTQERLAVRERVAKARISQRKRSL